MSALTWTFGILGWLSVILAILTATDAIPEITPAFTVTFWMDISIIFFLNTIVFVFGSRKSY